MNLSLSQSSLAHIDEEARHFTAAPEAFFQAWRRGVALAGVQFFSNGSCDSLHLATSHEALPPNLPLISQHLNVLSSGEKKFLAAMASFYNACDSRELLSRAGINGMADFASLDLQRRRVIAALLLNYPGW